MYSMSAGYEIVCAFPRTESPGWLYSVYVLTQCSGHYYSGNIWTAYGLYKEHKSEFENRNKSRNRYYTIEPGPSSIN